MLDLRSISNVREALIRFLEEDIGSGDITGESTIPEDLAAKAEIICKSPGCIVSGLDEAAMVFDICGCDTQICSKDGCKIGRGRVVIKVTGNARAILKAERTALNLIMRMSGIATETHKLASRTRGVKILATRKTAPGLRYFDKKAVIAGGGGAHRMRLDDMVLIKDNHIALAGPPSLCVRKARDRVGTAIQVECEVGNLEQAVDAIKAGADIIMLDNFTPARAEKAIKELSKMGLRRKCKIEISGGVNERNIRQFAKCNPDFISLGYITHSPRAVDFSLEMKPA